MCTHAQNSSSQRCRRGRPARDLSARPSVCTYSHRDEEDDDANEPDSTLPCVKDERASEGEGSHFLDNDCDRLIDRKGLHPPGHRLNWDECSAHEGKWENPNEAK